MDKEKSEQIKIALLAIIAALMIVKTVMMQSPGVNSSQEPVRRTGAPPETFINDMGGITVQGTNPGVPGLQQQITPQPVLPQPREVTSMTFDQTSGDLGAVSITDNKTHTFNVTNTGLIPLTFDQINADPGLTIVSQPKAPIAPGGKGTITVQLTAEAGTGPITKTIHVGSNTEPAHMHLTLSADIQ